MEKSGCPPEWTECSPPPPYSPIAASSSVNNSAVPMIHLPQVGVGGLHQPASNSEGTSQSTIPLEQPGTDLLTTAIGHNDQFFLRQTETMGRHAEVAKIEILDANGHQIISSLAKPAVATKDKGVRDSVEFTDAAGNVVLTMAEVCDSLTVTSENRILGMIEGSSSTSCLPNVIPKYVNGESFSIQKRGRTRIFVSPLNGAEVGRAGELASKKVFEIRLSPGLAHYYERDTICSWTHDLLIAVFAYEVRKSWYKGSCEIYCLHGISDCIDYNHYCPAVRTAALMVI